MKTIEGAFSAATYNTLLEYQQNSTVLAANGAYLEELAH